MNSLKAGFPQKLSLIILGLLLAGCTRLTTPDVKIAKAEKNIPPKVQDLLSRASANLKKQPQFVLEIEAQFDRVNDQAQKLRSGTSAIRYWLKRPNKVRAEVKSDEKDRIVWYNGTSLTVLDNRRNVYALTEAPPTIDETLDLLVLKYGVSIPVMDILYSSPAAGLLEYVESAEYLGISTIGAKRCHHLFFSQEFTDWQLWLEDTAELLPCKLLITYRTEAGQPQYEAQFLNWSFPKELSDSNFESSIPANIRRVTLNPNEPVKK